MITRTHVGAMTLLAAFLVPTGHAQAQDWSFKNFSVNHLDWTGSTERRTGTGPFGQKKDFNYVEAEGGLGGKWGDLYGFFDIENPTYGTHEAEVGKSRRFAWKVVGRVEMGRIADVPVQFYAHVYDFTEGDFNDQNRVVGLGSFYGQGDFWVKPFLGIHQESKSGVGAHVNGGMGGWVLGYSFKALDQSLMVTSWHELEFARKDEYLGMARDGAAVTGSKTGQNGALSLWWNINKTLTTGLSYRYASHKLGYAGAQDALIYTLKVNY